MADVYIVGRYAGIDAMASSGSASNSVLLFMNIAVGLNMGANVVIATSFGQRDITRVKNGIRTGIIIAAVISIVFTIIGIVFTDWIL
ncbi:MAG: MATE family efflux transporter, partial [Pseudobutyrivibrio sp.]|nr:MATE family efflux transporter [Pseudobutyrivibrio sp.]